MNMQSKESPRQLGFWMCVALVMGSMIGTGIFMLPVSLAPYGMNAVWAWMLGGAGAIFLALCFAALCRAFPEVEGPYAYTRIAFGELTAFLVAWAYWISLWVFNAAIAVGAASYLGNLVPAFGSSPTASAATTLAVLWLVTAVNLRGVRDSGKFSVATTALKLIPLAALAGLLLWLVAAGNPQVTQSPLLHTPVTTDGLTAAATLTLSALIGFESAAVMSSRVRDPERNIPRATVAGTALTALVYVVACSAVMLVIPAETLGKATAPFADVATLFWGPVAGHWIALFVVISAVGCLNAGVMMSGELPLQMARRGVFPAIFMKESKRLTPSVALIGSSLLASALVLMTYQKTTAAIYSFIAVLATTATLVLYLACALAVLVLLARGGTPLSRRGTAGLAACGLLGTLYALWCFVGAGNEAMIYGLVLLGAGVPVYYLMRRFGAAVPAA